MSERSPIYTRAAAISDVDRVQSYAENLHSDMVRVTSSLAQRIDKLEAAELARRPDPNHSKCGWGAHETVKGNATVHRWLCFVGGDECPAKMEDEDGR